MKCVRRAVALGILILAFEHHPAIAACDPTSADASAIAAARAEIASSCNCASAPNHGNYVTCAGGILRTRVQRNQLSNDCRGVPRRAPCRHGTPRRIQRRLFPRCELFSRGARAAGGNPMKPRATWLALLVLLLVASPAAAWDSKCYLQSAVPDPGVIGGLRAECQEGPETARNRWLGPSDEHRALLEFGRIFGGLPHAVSEDIPLQVFT